MKKIIAGLLIVTSIHQIMAQPYTTTPWEQRDNAQKKPLEYPYIREADVMWSKNIWRVIDVRQKLNLPFAYPQQPLIQIIHEAAKKGEINVYDPTVLNADQLVKKMEVSAVQQIGERSDSVWGTNPESLGDEMFTVEEHLRFDRVVKYRLKEVWYFDTKHSTMQVRILAIAPVLEDYDANGNYRGDMTMYWVPFESLRHLFAKNEVYNPQNDWQHYSWDDLFNMRKFQSYIYKESNVYDRNIQEYASAVDAQLESDRIRHQIMEYEHDLWNY
ncbi:MAG: gliding motility protein GldN [Chitinophagales bacterium]|nr:gliding motility protein GldN [Chitinophagales bacterium]